MIGTCESLALEFPVKMPCRRDHPITTKDIGRALCVDVSQIGAADARICIQDVIDLKLSD